MKLFATLCALCLVLSVRGQQLPQYTQFQKNPYLVNPAATGAHDMFNMSLGGRLQWVGLSNAPSTTYLYLSTPASKFRSAFMNRTYGKVTRNNKSVKHPKMRVGNVIQGFGGQLLADQFGAFRTLKFAGSYAVHLPINRDFTMSFGTNAGLSSHTFLSDKAQVLSSMTGTGVNDAVYNAQVNTGAQYVMDIDAGMYFYGNGFYAGFAAMNLTKDLVRFGNLNTNFAPVMHFFGSAGYRFAVNNSMDVTPGILVKYVQNAPVSVEANVLMDFNNVFWTGITYRHLDAVAFLAGTTIKEKFRIGYSFDLSISRLIKYNSGGHELVLSYIFGEKRRSFSRI
ncbi:MAG: type IX secretion system membrane protein PorP/SprF [bacterium]|nr:type IX secretion system membrane protein PorP/SprF [bacterium]